MRYYTSKDVLAIIDYLNLDFDHNKKAVFKRELLLQYCSLNNKNIGLLDLISLTCNTYSKVMSDHNRGLEEKLKNEFMERFSSNPTALIEINEFIRPKTRIIISTMN